jgi:diguanylate cyclase (GGDEF)-like protein
MYMPFLMYGYAATLALMLLGCRLAMRTMPRLDGLRLLSWSMIFGLGSVIGFAMRPWAPVWLTIVAANLFLMVGMLLIYCAVADILAVPMKFLPWGVRLGIVVAAAFVWFTWFHPSQTARILLSSGICAIYAGAAAYLLFRHAAADAEVGLTSQAVRLLTSSLAWMQMAMALLHVARCVLTVLFPPENMLHLDLIQAGYSYLNLLLDLGNICGLIWLALCIHRSELQKLALTDGLTGLLNRRAFEEILARDLTRTERGGGSLAVLLLDIDRFKDVNDSLGHHAGDEVIRRVSTALRDGLRPADALARYGGEEFAILMRGRSLEQGRDIAERLRAAIARLEDLPGDWKITASIGVAASQRTDTPDGLLRRCDEALYGSKRGGRNLVTADGGFKGAGDVSVQPA